MFCLINEINTLESWIFQVIGVKDVKSTERNAKFPALMFCDVLMSWCLDVSNEIWLETC